MSNASSGENLSDNDGEKSPSKNRFTSEEDNLLRELVEKNGENWSFIADEMKTKNPRQCRNRWRFYLNPNVNNEPFTEEETKALMFWVEKCGTDWATMVGMFPGRTCPALKNHFVTYCNRNSIDKNVYVERAKAIRQERKKRTHVTPSNK